MGNSESLKELELELQSQLQEDHETLEAVKSALDEDPDNEEMQQMHEQLAAAVKESEQALLQLKRDRLLQELNARIDCNASDTAISTAAVTTTTADLGTVPLISWQPLQRCVFRSTDGRYYFGIVQTTENEAVRLQFATPTRPHQLEPLVLPPSSLLQPRTPLLALHQLDPGSRVIVRPPRRQLWVGAEVVALDPGEGRVEVSTEEGGTLAVSIADVALSAYVDDPWGEDEDEEGGESGSESGSLNSQGSDFWENEGAEEGPSGREGSEDEEGIPCGRVSVALSDAAAATAAAAQAGPQTDTRLFSSWEAHTRGIGSKMLAGMGYKGGGLGRQQQGLAAPLQAARLRKGAGLGVEPSKGIREGKQTKRKRGGEKARQRKAAKAAFEQRETARQAQHKLEKRTGTEGVFAFINSMIGDGSGAAAVHRAAEGVERGQGSGRGIGTSRGKGAQGTWHQHGHDAAARNKEGQHREGPAAVAKEVPDRRALASQQGQLAVMRQKVARLAEMAKRNAKDKVMLPQINRALADARSQLQAAEQSHSSTQRAIQDKEKQNKWTKF